VQNSLQSVGLQSAQMLAMASGSAGQWVTQQEPQAGETQQTLVACVFPEQQDQPYGVLPRRLYIVGWDARQNLERVEEGVISTQV
jgi:hypothetical protein